LLPVIGSPSVGDLWENNYIVEEYSKLSALHKPEQIILNLIKPELSKVRMLDIGVGAGRTTIYFAPIVKEYLGIDSSVSMINVCKRKFLRNKSWTFKVLDARNLQEFRNDEFGFVMFSFNGLDYILNHKDRQETLSEIRRILKPKGYFYFATHNLNCLRKDCKFRSLSRNEIRRMLLMRVYNWNVWKKIRANKNINYAVANNGTHNFKTQNYFVLPNYQIDVLKSLGFKQVMVFDLEGRRLKHSEIRNDEDNSYLHYLCR
jgi:ubiquinone/menaquinone biosynthesis C-methylase UbiE